ncbi:uncharacterized protein EI90DRAFT_3006951 [Cantharellus anzutake]|uniref:uncharacterized protein n=1 Tax=Cantharellus anzutake TaxID=1750568 RepID=UPI001908AE9E|nr:uncharacterized protein EI90DRAFT_3006951 [Cantharellus anzutake]KAF8310344.1 hypothetical protein EI90DRAFT_3006951 [Cantharellus anzutake]
MEPQPLPRTPEQLRPELSDEQWKAYSRCLSLEKLGGWGIHVPELQEAYSEDIMAQFTACKVARILGYCLLAAPSKQGCDALTREILGCAGKAQKLECADKEEAEMLEPVGQVEAEMLAGLAHLYIYGLTRVFFNPKGRTPILSPGQSPRGSFEQAEKRAADWLLWRRAPYDSLKQLVLLRDDHRCAFTGLLDKSFVGCAPRQLEFRGKQVNVTGMDVERTKPDLGETYVAHIITKSLSEDIEGQSEGVKAKFQWAKKAVALIERFGGFSFTELGIHGLDNPLNVFTTSDTPHKQFDALNLWLVPALDQNRAVIANNTYAPEHSGGDVALKSFGIQKIVKFKEAKTEDGQVVPPPDPRLLALHAACAWVLHSSGAIEHVREFLLREPEPISLMTEPNAAPELHFALEKLQYFRHVSTMA